MAYEEKFMLDALKEADKAPAEHEVPVGAVVVCEGKTNSPPRRTRSCLP